MNRIGLFVDVSNLYHCCNAKFGNRKLNYKELHNYVEGFGTVTQALAYGAQMNEEAASFIRALKSFGYTPKYKKPKVFRIADGKEIRRSNWNVGISVDVFSRLDKLDTIVLGSADSDLEPLVTYCIEHGFKVVIIGCRISKALVEVASEFIEIPESLMEQARKPTLEDKIAADLERREREAL